MCVILFIAPLIARGVDFKAAFRMLRGSDSDPYPWQARLYDRFVGGDIPDELGIPTGLGKTSVMHVWLAALASARSSGTGPRVPMRLVYIVDRRVIVDQATDDARRMAGNLAKNGAAFGGMSRLHISTFRGGGGTADSRDWMRHPDEPALLIGTVDMIGSRLLFSGYGLGRRVRPFYAGLLGQDSLIVLDEAHLSPALARTLFDVEKMSRCPPDQLFPPKVMLMSATGRTGNPSRRIFGLEDGDLGSSAVRRRYEAKKMLSLKDAGRQDLASAIADQALAMSGRTLVYVQAPSNAAFIATKLRAEKKPVVVLTGTMRGFERDRLTRRTAQIERDGDSRDVPGGNAVPRGPENAKGGAGGIGNDIFNAFISNDSGLYEGDCYLVATSAGEVGVDIDADNMVCDLSTLDSLVQRLGRVNRSGGRVSKVTVVHSDDVIRKSRSLSKQLEKTLALLKDLTNCVDPAGDKAYDASPRALSEIAEDRKEGTAAPGPCTQPLAPDVVGMWSMTSLYKPYPTRPAVHHWLRGHEEANIPDTYVAWRDDVARLAEACPAAIERVLDKYPILPHEMARGTTARVRKILESVSKKRRGAKAIIQKPDSTVSIKKLEEIGDDDLRYSTLLLPCSAGGLDESGILAASNARVRDVADDPQYKDRCRITVHVWADGRAAVVDGNGESEGGERDLDEWLAKNNRMRRVSSVVTSASEDDYDRPTVELRYYAARPESQNSASAAPQSVADHNDDVKRAAKQIAGALGLGVGLADAVAEAAARHDLGKSHRHWQECMHGDVDSPLAKTPSRMRPLDLGGFRHEFESMKQSYDGLASHPERDLVLHLIAAHHGWARPCFKPNAGADAAERYHLDAVRRYATLEKRFGPWGLAWLEGIVRGADWRVSEQAGGDRD